MAVTIYGAQLIGTIRRTVRPVRVQGAKSAPRQIWEMVTWGGRLITTPNDYRAHSLYMRGVQRTDAMRFLSVSRAKDILWPLNTQPEHLHNKLLFETHFSSVGLPVPQTIAVIGEAQTPHGIERLGSSDVALKFLGDALRAGRQLAIKPVDRWGGEGVHVLAGIDRDGFLLSNGERISSRQLQDRISFGVWLVQKRIIQHPKLAEINSSSLNTLRLGTFRRKNGEVKIVFVKLRMGRAHTQVDSSHLGGYSVRIDPETGSFADRAIPLAQASAAPWTQHPDSGVLFAGRVFPLWDDVVRMSKAFARAAGANQFIGWDVAMAPEGPVFVEGNHTWNVQGAQIGSSGMLTNEFVTMLHEETGVRIDPERPPPFRPLRAIAELRNSKS